VSDAVAAILRRRSDPTQLLQILCEAQEGLGYVPTAGAFMVLGKERDLFEAARNFAHFFAHESCGFCTPCRVGTALMRDTLDKIADGRGSRYEINELMRLAGHPAARDEPQLL
jgi:NADH:ubiquinone oxidoreductase subunit F (NADH-binding)